MFRWEAGCDVFCAYVCAYVCLCVWCLEKIAEATRKFAALQSDLSTSEELQPEVSSRLRRRSVVATTLVRRRKKAGSVSERVVYKSMNDIKLALSEFYLSLILLQNYQSLNFTGFCKILKKHDKVVSLYQRQWIDNHTVYWQDCPRGKLLVLHLLRIESFDYHCRGVIITDSVTSPFTTIYIVYSSTHSLGGHGDKQKKVLKSTFSSTDSDRIWRTPRRDRDASNLIFWHVGNSPNSKKVDFSPKFRKFISRKRAEIFSLDFRDL